MVNFYFLFTLLSKQSKAIGRVEPEQWIFQPGHYDLAHPGVVPPLVVIAKCGCT